jgi:hypothetical protein
MRKNNKSISKIIRDNSIILTNSSKEFLKIYGALLKDDGLTGYTDLNAKVSDYLLIESDLFSYINFMIHKICLNKTNKDFMKLVPIDFGSNLFSNEHVLPKLFKYNFSDKYIYINHTKDGDLIYNIGEYSYITHDRLNFYYIGETDDVMKKKSRNTSREKIRIEKNYKLSNLQFALCYGRFFGLDKMSTEEIFEFDNMNYRYGSFVKKCERLTILKVIQIMEDIIKNNTNSFDNIISLIVPTDDKYNTLGIKIDNIYYSNFNYRYSENNEFKSFLIY